MIADVIQQFSFPADKRNFSIKGSWCVRDSMIRPALIPEVDFGTRRSAESLKQRVASRTLAIGSTRYLNEYAPVAGKLKSPSNSGYDAGYFRNIQAPLPLDGEDCPTHKNMALIETSL